MAPYSDVDQQADQQEDEDQDRHHATTVAPSRVRMTGTNNPPMPRMLKMPGHDRTTEQGTEVRTDEGDHGDQELRTACRPITRRRDRPLWRWRSA